MNLVTLLIPFLLLSAQFVSYAVIDTTLPAICASTCGEVADDAQPLALRLTVSRAGYELQSSGGRDPQVQEGLVIPCSSANCTGDPSEAWDTRALREVLVELKTLHPDEDHTTVIPAGDVPYEALILAMDTLREDPDGAGDGQCNGQCLFPFVTIAGGVAAR